jgi:hypothetical protein
LERNTSSDRNLERAVKRSICVEGFLFIKMAEESLEFSYYLQFIFFKTVISYVCSVVWFGLFLWTENKKVNHKLRLCGVWCLVGGEGN